MSIAISLKVNDGLVLATDSASTVVAQRPGAEGQLGVANIYDNANKVFNIVKGKPVGMVTWGAGSIGPASISTLAKDLRQRLSEDPDKQGEWTLDQQSYTVEEVAQKVKRFMFGEAYTEAFRDWEREQKPAIGFIVAGYSAQAAMAEEYIIKIEQGECPDPSPLRSQPEVGLTWDGQPEAIGRLVFGFGSQLPAVLEQKLGVPHEQIEPTMRTIAQVLQVPLIHPAMPIQDAINLAEFLVELTIKFHQYLPGAPTAGGPIEVAAITKHEGFRWVRRKYYFSRELNPESYHATGDQRHRCT